MFGHAGIAFPNPGTPMGSQIGQQQPVSRREHRSHRQPELMASRKRMDQQNGKAGSLNFVKEVGIAAADVHYALSVSASFRQIMSDDWSGPAIARARVLPVTAPGPRSTRSSMRPDRVLH